MKNNTIVILKKELKKGENSGFIENFDRKAFIKKLHEKHLTK